MLGGGLSPSVGGLAEHHPAVGDQHLIARVHPQQQRRRASRRRPRRCRCAAVGAVGADARQQRHVAQLRRVGRSLIARRPRCGCTAAGRRAPARRPPGRRRAAARRRAPHRARCRCSAAASRRPPWCSTSRSAMANPGVRRQQVLHHLDDARASVVAMPSSRPAVSEDTTVESAPDCSQQVLVLGLPDRGDDLGVGRELARGERDQDGGVVAVGGDDDRLGVLGAGQPQHVGVGGAAADGDQAGALGALERGRVARRRRRCRRARPRRRPSRRPPSCPWCRSRRRWCGCALCSSIAGSSVPGATAWSASRRWCRSARSGTPPAAA